MTPLPTLESRPMPTHRTLCALLLAAMAGHLLAEAELVGRYQRGRN